MLRTDCCAILGCLEKLFARRGGGDGQEGAEGAEQAQNDDHEAI